MKTIRSLVEYSIKKNLGAEQTKLLWSTIILNHPIYSLFRQKRIELSEKFDRIQEEGLNPRLHLSSQELMSKFWNDKIFTMRSSSSRIYAQSKFLKDF